MHFSDRIGRAFALLISISLLATAAACGDDPTTTNQGNADMSGDMSDVGADMSDPVDMIDGDTGGGDGDRDDDGLLDEMDNCPDVSNSNQADQDGDGVGNVCDNCPEVANLDQADADGDGTGDACQLEGDRDGDLVLDELDNCPDTDNADQADTDGDGRLMPYQVFDVDLFERVRSLRFFGASGPILGL